MIQFPEQELASEYVFPVLKKTDVVLNRSVTLSNRIEWRVSGVWIADEPLYSPLSILSSLSFYFNEFHGIGVSGIFFTPWIFADGLSEKGDYLRTIGIKTKTSDKKEPINKIIFFDASLAPYPQYAMFLNYKISPFYGKISFTKNFVLNFSLYSFFGVGSVALKHGFKPFIVVPSVNFGAGQKIYFNPYLSLDLGIDFLLYRGPNPVLKDLKYVGQKLPVRPLYKSFQQVYFFRFLVRLGFTLLFF